MYLRGTFVILIVFLLSAFGAASSVFAAQNMQQKDWTLNLKEVDITVFLEQVSSITGENFVVDPTVKGKVSVVATTPMNADAVHELLLTVLRVNGFAAVPAGTATRIVPQANVKMGEGAIKTSSGQQQVTRVIPLKNGNVGEVVRVLKPLVSQTGYLEGSEYSNAIIVSDYGDNVNQILTVLRGLDKQQSISDVEVIPLKQVWVGNIVPLIEAIAPMQLEESGKSHNRLRVVADERNNSIIVRGDKNERAQIRQLVEKFDIQNNEANNIQMIHLQYSDAREVASLLRGMLSAKDEQNISSSTATTTQGSPAAAITTNEDASGMQSAIQANVTLNTIVVRAEPAMMNEVRAIVKQLDVRRPQVLIEAAIVEITADKSQRLGVQLAGGNTAATFNGGTTQFAGAGLSIGDILTRLGNARAADVSGEGLAVTLGTKAGFNILLQALASTTGANLLSTPSIITLDNEEAKIVVGQNVPFRTGSFSTQNSGVTNPFTTIERQDIGITLKVMPQIHEGNLVKMNIEQEVSSIAPTTVQTSGAADIVTNKRTIQTKVLAEDGETIVLGGLIEDDITETDTKVPLLGDIPVLGSLFSSKSHSSTKKNLLVFLRPTVLRGSEQMAGVTQRGYGQVYDLMLGRKNLADVNDAGMPERILDAGSVFEMPPKKLPWLVGGGGGVSELPASDVPTTQSALDNQLLEPQPLPWLTTSSPAAPVTPVESGSQQSPAPVTLTPPQ